MAGSAQEFGHQPGPGNIEGVNSAERPKRVAEFLEGSGAAAAVDQRPDRHDVSLA